MDAWGEVEERDVRNLISSNPNVRAQAAAIIKWLPRNGVFATLLPRISTFAGALAGSYVPMLANLVPGNGEHERELRLILRGFGSSAVRGVFEGVSDAAEWDSAVDTVLDDLKTTDPADTERKAALDRVAIAKWPGSPGGLHRVEWDEVAGDFRVLCRVFDDAYNEEWERRKREASDARGRRGGRTRPEKPEYDVMLLEDALAIEAFECKACLGKTWAEAKRPKKVLTFAERCSDDVRKAISAAVDTGVELDSVYLQELMRATMDELSNVDPKWLSEWASGVTFQPNGVLLVKDVQKLVEHVMCFGDGKIELDHRIKMWGLRAYEKWASSSMTLPTWMKVVGVGIGLTGIGAAFGAILYALIGVGIWIFGAFGPLNPAPAFVCMIIGTLVLLSVVLGLSPFTSGLDFAAGLLNKEWKPGHGVAQRIKELVFSVGGVLGLIFLPIIVLLGSPLLPKLAVIILILANGTALAVLENISKDQPSPSRGYKAKSADWMLKRAPIFQVLVLVWAFVLFVLAPATINGVVPWQPVQATAVETNMAVGDVQVQVPVINTPDGYVVLDEALTGAESQNLLSAMTVSCPLPSDTNPNPTCDLAPLTTPFGARVRVPGYVMKYVPLQSNPQEYVPHLARQRAHVLTQHLPGAEVYQSRTQLAPAVLGKGLAQAADLSLISGTEFSVADEGVSRAIYTMAKQDRVSWWKTRLGYILGAGLLITLMVVLAVAFGLGGKDDRRGLKALVFLIVISVFAVLVLGIAMFAPIPQTFAQEYAETVTEAREDAAKLAEKDAALERKYERQDVELERGFDHKDRKNAFKESQREKYGTWWSRTFGSGNTDGNTNISILSSPVVMPARERTVLREVGPQRPQVSRSTVCPTAVPSTPVYERFRCGE